MFRSTRTVVLLGVAVQLVAFLRTVLIAKFFGASLAVDAYNLGLIAPAFIATVVGSWLQVGFVGRYASLVATDKRELAAAYRARMLFLIFVSTLFITAICTIWPHKIMGLFLPADQGPMIGAAADALRWTGFILIPIILGDFIGLILNCHGLFFAAACAPLANAAISVGALWIWPEMNLRALLITLLLGSAAQAIVVVAAIGHIGLTFPLRTTLARREVQSTLLLALPLWPAMMLSNSAAAIVQFRSAGFGEGAVTTFGYAARFNNALAQVLVIGLSTVLLPHFAALWSRNERTEILVIFRRLARCIVFLVGYLTIGIYLMGDLSVQVLLQRGAFDPTQTLLVSWLWFILSLSLFPLAFGTFIAKFCQALRGAGSILISSVLSFIATWTVAAIGASTGNLTVVTAAIVAGPSLATCFWLLWLRTKIDTRPIIGDICTAGFRAILALSPAAILEAIVQSACRSLDPTIALLSSGIAYTACAAALFLITKSHRWAMSP